MFCCYCDFRVLLLTVRLMFCCYYDFRVLVLAVRLMFCCYCDFRVLVLAVRLMFCCYCDFRVLVLAVRLMFCCYYDFRVLVLAVILGVVHFDPASQCTKPLQDHVIGYIVIMCLCALIEGVIAVISMRGSILYTDPRSSMQYLLYIRLGESCL